MTARSAMFQYLDRLHKGDEFYTVDVTNHIYHKVRQKPFSATLLRYMRDYRQKKGVDIRCIDIKKSKYKHMGKM